MTAAGPSDRLIPYSYAYDNIRSVLSVYCAALCNRVYFDRLILYNVDNIPHQIVFEIYNQGSFKAAKKQYTVDSLTPYPSVNTNLWVMRGYGLSESNLVDTRRYG